MPLIPVPDMMRHAIRHGYAIGYFESWNLVSLQGVLDAAERSRSPVIVGFNGEFLSRLQRLTEERLTWYGALGRAAAESAKVPVGLIFNECPQDDRVREAVTAGFNLVMPVASDGEAHADYAHRVTSLTKFAHDHRVAVEAELGILPYGTEMQGGNYTDPERAREFVAATGIDLLAVSVGNIHVLLNGQRELDLDKVAALHEQVPIPLVLHGGTGIGAKSLREAIHLGVAKVNYGTYLKQHYLAATRQAMANDDPNPHHLLGYGGEDDILVAGRRAVCEAVLTKVEILGCTGKADSNE